ncbi:MAG: hypothetical protein OEV30_00490 [Ignavibacteria bacterium]|nr:hypothetical protein [Ignavibacteria bacterium]
MFLTILSCILGYYLLTLLYQAARLYIRRREAARSPMVRFDFSLFTDESVGKEYRFVSITPWFYEESEKHFTFAFSLLGFRIFFIPTETMEPVVREHVAGLLCWQVVYDSADLIDSEKGMVPVAWGERGVGFSPGDDMMFMTRQPLDKEKIEKFRADAIHVRRFPRKMTAGILQVFQPEVVVLKEGNRWMIGFRDSDKRGAFLQLFLRRVGEKILRKNGIAGGDVDVDSSAADRFISRGQVTWWVTGKIDGENVVFDAEGIRPGEATSADWALVSIPFRRSSSP